MASVESPAVAPRPGPSLEAWPRDRVFVAGLFFALAVAFHNADHVRRGADAVQGDVFWLGAAAVAVEVALVVLICQRHRLAPLGAAVAGLLLAVGYVFVHFLPERSWLSDPLLTARGIDDWSIAAAAVEAIAALVLGLTGLAALRQFGSVATVHPRQRTLRAGLAHPVALVFLLTQVVTLTLAFAQV